MKVIPLQLVNNRITELSRKGSGVQNRTQCKILQPSGFCCMFNNCSNVRYSGPLMFC
jgi:hypothetical protein